MPASFVIVATTSIVGLGWGRATRTTRLSQTVRGEVPGASPGALEADAQDAPTVGSGPSTPSPGDRSAISDGAREDIPQVSDLFEPEATARVILLQNVVPTVATGAAFLVFRFAPIA